MLLEHLYSFQLTNRGFVYYISHIVICHISRSGAGGESREGGEAFNRTPRAELWLPVLVVLALWAGAACGSAGGDQEAGPPAEGEASTVADTDRPDEQSKPSNTRSEPAADPEATPDSTEARAVLDTGADAGEVAEADPQETVDQPHLPVPVVDETGASITVESVERIIPLDGDIAEVVFALGLGDRVVATDLSATYPPEADDLPQIGYQRALSTEPIAAFEPTVLLATALAGPPETLDELRRLGFPLIIVPSEPTSQGPGMKIRAVASALGVPGRGEALAAEVENAIAETAAQTECGTDCPRVLMVYVRGTSAQLVFGESSPTRWLIEAAGGVDVSGELGVVDPTPISAEAIVSAAPDVLITTEAGLESVGGLDGLLEIPGLAGTPAGREGRVLAYDAQLLLENGPRVADLLSQLTSDLKTVSETGKE